MVVQFYPAFSASFFQHSLSSPDSAIEFIRLPSTSKEKQLCIHHGTLHTGFAHSGTLRVTFLISPSEELFSIAPAHQKSRQDRSSKITIMSGLDVEALLDSTAYAAPPKSSDSQSKDRESRHKSDRHDRRDRDRDRDRYRDDSRDRERRRRDRSRDRGGKSKDLDGDVPMKSPSSARSGGHERHRSRRRSRSRDEDKHRSRRHRDPVDDDAYRASGGDYYRGGGRPRTRSRSPPLDDRYYRPSGRPRHGDEERTRDRSPRRDSNSGRKRTPSPPKKSPTPQPTEDERDRRTVFVQQLAARLRTKELIGFFEKVGPVKEAQIVKDRVSGRSKGYVNLLLCLWFPCTDIQQCWLR